MNTTASLVVITSLLATPAAASVRDAAFASSADSRASTTSMFAGATYRLGLHPKDKARNGRASFRVAGITTKPGSAEIRFGQGLELTGMSGKPAFLIAGHDAGELKKRAQMSTGGKIAIAVGVVALAGAIAFGVWYREATYCDRNDCE